MNQKTIINCLFIIVFSILPGFLLAQTADQWLDQPVFNKLNAQEGLSQGRISDIIQDSAGFMWFGTRDGLNRWDGYSMQVYKNSPGNPNSIQSNIIEKILMDNKGVLWILTGKGLCKHQPGTDIFTPYEIPGKIDESKIFDFNFDRAGKLLLATHAQGLIEIDTATLKLTEYNLSGVLDANDDIRLIFVSKDNKVWLSKRKGGALLFDRTVKTPVSIKSLLKQTLNIDLHYITSIVEDNDNNLWMGTGDTGLIFVDTKKLALKSFFFLENGDYLQGRVILDLMYCDDDNIWIGTDSEGLVCFNIKNHIVRQFREGETENNLLYKTISSLYFDRSGNLWIGTNGKGLNILSPFSKKFYSVTKNTASTLNLSFESVRSIYEDKDNILWVGGYSGMQRIDFQKNTSELAAPHVIYSICPDPEDDNILWLGTEGGGLKQFDKSNRQLTALPVYNEYGEKPLSDDMLHGYRIYDILAAPDNRLLIATAQGLNVFNPRTKTFRFLKINLPDPSYMIESGLTTIYYDSHNCLWLGTFTEGLIKMNSDFSAAKNFTNKPEKQDLPGNRVNCIHEDSQGRFWIATNMGLCMMDRDTESFTTYTEAEGLPNNTVYGILEDSLGHLWLSTNNGISNFNPNEKTFKNYNQSDGLPGNEFNSAAYFQYNKSRLYFGGVDGLVAFNPQNVVSDEEPPAMNFTRMKIFYSDTVYNINLSNKSYVEINPNAILLEIEFSAFNFINPYDCSYAYQFGEKTLDWINLGNKRIITLTNPSHGEYVINIKASNSDGFWNNDPKTLRILVLPEFYQTLWFRIMIITVILAGIVFVFYLKQIIHAQQQKKLQLLIEQRTRELSAANIELNRANASKDKFFSIIAHDLKNPFNSLLGFTDLLVDEWKKMNDNEKHDIVKILKNTIENTYDLLLNLLEWSKLQRKKSLPVPEQFKISEVIDDIVSQLNVISELKNISIETEIIKDQWIYYDLTMFGTIIRNLVGNAIKFSHKNGKIVISAYSENEDFIICKVRDNGIGMDEERTRQIFDEDNIQSTPGTGGETGTGLGLAITHEFVKLNGGKLFVESKPGEGSSFYFSIPTKIPGEILPQNEA